jgi:hypothetical protein
VPGQLDAVGIDARQVGRGQNPVNVRSTDKLLLESDHLVYRAPLLPRLRHPIDRLIKLGDRLANSAARQA